MEWTDVFGCTPLNYGRQLAKVANHMQKVVFDSRLDGEKLRILFSNLYSAKPLDLESVLVGRVRNGKSLSSVMITKDGREKIHLEPREEAFSDEADFAVRAGEQLEVFLYIKEEQSIGSVCALSSRNRAQVTNGWPRGKEGQLFYGFSRVQLLTSAEHFLNCAN